MECYSIEEIENICSRCLTKDNEDIKRFVEIFKYYQKNNDTKKLEALANIFNQCFKTEREWYYDKSTDESKFIGYNVYITHFQEIISSLLKKQYQKITKLKFIEENKNKELQDSINMLE